MNKQECLIKRIAPFLNTNNYHFKEEMKEEPFSFIEVDTDIKEDEDDILDRVFNLPDDVFYLGARVNRLKYIVNHCTASFSYATAEAIQRYMLSKWRIGGYNIIVKRDGSIKVFYPANVVTNGVLGQNPICYHISWIGGIDDDTKQPLDNRTRSQKETIRLLNEECYNHFVKQGAKIDDIVGHNFFQKSRACPVFDVHSELGYILDK